MRFIIMAVAWLVFFLATFHMCVKPTCCPDGEGRVEANGAAAGQLAQEGPFAVASTLGASGAALITAGAEWPDRLDELRRTYAADPDQALQVYGHYYASEPKPPGYENMGLMRAERIKEMIVRETDIPADKIRPLARLLPAPPPGDGEKFEAANLVWEELGAGVDADTGGETSQVVELDTDNIEVRFPYNESTKRLDGQTEDYLRKLAQRIQATRENVTVVGHTDIRGTDDYNQRLGQRRAEFVKSRLTSYGAPAGQINTSSRGETQLAAQGNTDDAHRRNRRAEITLQRR